MRSQLCGRDIWVKALGIVHVAHTFAIGLALVVRAHKARAALSEDVNV